MIKEERTFIKNKVDCLSKEQWKLFIDGDNEAYSWLYSHYVRQLYQFGCRFTNDSEVVKDCIQDVFTQIYQNRTNLSMPENVKVYLMSAIKNSLFNYFKKQQLLDAYSSQLSEKESYNFDLSIEDAIIEDETKDSWKKTLSDVVNRLPVRQREIIYYRFYEGLEYEEICELMNMNEQSAYNLLQRSLSKLRKMYGTSFVLLLLLSFSLMKH